MRTFICSPATAGRDETKKRIREKLKAVGITVSGPEHEDPWYRQHILRTNSCRNEPMYCLSKDLQYMSMSDACYFTEGWEKDTNCRIEHEVAKEYGLVLMYEEKENETAETAHGCQNENGIGKML